MSSIGHVRVVWWWLWLEGVCCAGVRIVCCRRLFFGYDLALSCSTITVGAFMVVNRVSVCVAMSLS